MTRQRPDRRRTPDRRDDRPDLTARRALTHRPTVAALAALATIGLAACGSTTGGDPSSADRVATNAAQDSTPGGLATPLGAGSSAGAEAGAGSASSAPTAASAAPSSVAPSVAPPGSGALPGVPAVTNAGDISKQPVAAAGTGTASARLVTRDLVVGSGTAASLADTVNVRYAGSIFASGSVFDASWGKPSQQSGVPDGEAQFPLSGVVPGFAQGIAGMKPGGRREIVIPPALGYGPQGGQPSAGISATDTLVFIVDLDKVVAP